MRSAIMTLCHTIYPETPRSLIRMIRPTSVGSHHPEPEIEIVPSNLALFLQGHRLGYRRAHGTLSGVSRSVNRSATLTRYANDVASRSKSKTSLLKWGAVLESAAFSS